MQYKPIRDLGRGGQGKVLLAQKNDGSLVVLKRLLKESPDEKDKQAFRDEADAARTGLDHIAKCLDIFHDPLVIVYEYIEGDDLRDLSPKDPPAKGCAPMPAEAVKAAAFFYPLALTLHELHNRGIFHRDITPGNIRVTPAGKTYLLDFGCVHFASSEYKGRQATKRYMSPQQGKGMEPTPADDVYSLGCVLAEYLTGRIPDEWSSSQIALLPLPLANILTKSTAASYEKRYANAKELADALKIFLDGQPDHSTPAESRLPPVPGNSIESRPSRYIWDYLGGICGGIGLLACLLGAIESIRGPASVIALLTAGAGLLFLGRSAYVRVQR